MLIARLCPHMFHAWLLRAWPLYACSTRGYSIIPRVAHNKLHEMCMFYAMRKRGPRKHVMGLFKVLFVVPCASMRVKMKL